VSAARTGPQGSAAAAISAGPTPELVALEGVGSVRRRGRYRLRHIERPGTLPRHVQDALLDMITRASEVMFDGADTARYWDERRDYFEQITDWWVADRDGCLAGWCAFVRWETPAGPALYIDTLGIMPRDRRSGIGTVLVTEAWMRRCIERRRAVVMTMRIQSPLILRMVLRCAAPWSYPRPGFARRRRTDRRAGAIAAHAAARTSPGFPFDAETFVIRGVFGRKLYGGPIPRTGVPALDDWFDRHLDIERGDALIAVMALTPVTVPIGVFVLLAVRLDVLRRERQRDA